MADYTTNTINTIVRSLETAVIPRVDPTDPFAVDQVRMVLSHIKFLEERATRIGSRARLELKGYVAMAQEVALTLTEDGDALTSLTDALTAGTRALNDPFTSVEELDRATGAIRTVLSRLARFRTLDAEATRIVCTASHAIVNMQRAYYGPMEWDPDVAAIPEFDDLVRAARA
jgi:hypothetical protein